MSIRSLLYLLGIRMLWRTTFFRFDSLLTVSQGALKVVADLVPAVAPGSLMELFRSRGEWENIEFVQR